MGEVVTFIRRPAPRGRASTSRNGAGQILLFTGAWRERYGENEQATQRVKRSTRTASRRRKKA